MRLGLSLVAAAILRMDRPAAYAAAIAQMRSCWAVSSRVTASWSRLASCFSRRTRRLTSSGVSMHHRLLELTLGCPVNWTPCAIFRAFTRQIPACMPNASHLFLSYSSRDRDKVRAVHRYLSERSVTTFFDQQNLRAGQNWPQALEQALRDSSAVAVFVGAQIGNWQWSEIGFALDCQANDKQYPVIPVLLDGADNSSSFLFLNTWVDLRGERLDDTEALNRLLDAVSRSGASLNEPLIDLNPYRGLEIFDEAHSPFFFGREKFIDDLFDRLTQQRKKFVAVIGASGSGKSSVVRAGLVPKLRRRRPPRETWDVAVFTPGERPWFRLADALGPLRFPDKSDTELDIEIDKLASALHSGELSLDSSLDRILQRQGKLYRLLLVVDQFEELFTLTPARAASPSVSRCVAMSMWSTVWRSAPMARA